MSTFTRPTTPYIAPEADPQIVDRYAAQGRAPVDLGPSILDGVQALGGYATGPRASITMWRDGAGFFFWTWQLTAGETLAAVVDDGLQTFGGYTASQASSPQRYTDHAVALAAALAFGALMNTVDVFAAPEIAPAPVAPDARPRRETLALIAVDTLGGRPVIRRETARAICVELSDSPVWFPLSQLRGFVETANGVYVVAPAWLAREKGLSSRSHWATEGEIVTEINAGRAAWL